MRCADHPGIVAVRPFAEGDVAAAAGFCERARSADPLVEPFAQRLPLLAAGPRALLGLWRVAEGEDGALHGLSLVALREERAAAGSAAVAPRSGGGGTGEGGAAQGVADLYAAVAPQLRRQGLARLLIEPALEWAQAAAHPVSLRARAPDDAAAAGRAFLEAQGFEQRSAVLSLAWRGGRPPSRPCLPGVRLSALGRGDGGGLADLARLSESAWAGAPDAFPARAGELASLLEQLERLVLLASVDGRAAGYLSAVWLGRTLGIEEVAVLPELRRAGLGRALVEEALARGAAAAVLSVAEENRPARALYRSLGFARTARRLIFELCGGAPPGSPR